MTDVAIRRLLHDGLWNRFTTVSIGARSYRYRPTLRLRSPSYETSIVLRMRTVLVRSSAR